MHLRQSFFRLALSLQHSFRSTYRSTPSLTRLSLLAMQKNPRRRTAKHSDLDVSYRLLLRKEVIQPHLPIRLPCYDFTPVIAPTLDGYFLAVSPPASGVNDFRGVTGGVYKARERIHRSMLTCDY